MPYCLRRDKVIKVTFVPGTADTNICTLTPTCYTAKDLRAWCNHARKDRATIFLEVKP